VELTPQQRQRVAWIIDGHLADDYDEDTHEQQRAQALAELATPEELFLFASESHPAQEPGKWRWVIEHPLCDRGTALLVFWRNSPVRVYSDELCENESDRERSELVREIAARCAANQWPFSRVRFDPTAFKGFSFLDSYEPDELARVPAHMLIPTPGAPVPPLSAADFVWGDD
jgi:hypothetical protein